jgi:hypothetical protein
MVSAGDHGDVEADLMIHRNGAAGGGPAGSARFVQLAAAICGRRSGPRSVPRWISKSVAAIGREKK